MPAKKRAPAREAAAGREALADALLSALPDLVFRIDRHGVYRYAHAPNGFQFTAPPEAFLGRSLAEVMPGDIVPGCQEALTRAFSTGKVVLHEYELAVPMPDGPKSRFEARIIPESAESVIVVVRNLTERSEAAREARLKDEQIRQAQRMESVGRLAGGIAHEFNNILAGIGGLAQLMRESLGPGRPESNDAQEILDACGRAAGLVAQLLTFSRNRAPRRGPVDASVFLERLVKVLRPSVDLKVSLEASAAPGTPMMLADISQLEQALVNLCLNSADAIEGPGVIRVRAEPVVLDKPRDLRLGTLAAGRWVRVRVSDTGSGIAPEHQTRVFEPFFTTKPVGQGTGLGLSVVYGIVSHHGGLVDLASGSDGTTVDLYIPVASDTLVDAVGPAAPSGQTRRTRGSETVLVAEDDKALRSVVVRSLERFGYDVVVAKDGAEAVRLLRERGGKVSLALLDVMMPNLEGYGAYEAMAPLNPKMKVLFMSGCADAGSRPVAVGLPFIQKPFSPESLAARVREVLDG